MAFWKPGTKKPEAPLSIEVRNNAFEEPLPAIRFYIGIRLARSDRFLDFCMFRTGL